MKKTITSCLLCILIVCGCCSAVTINLNAADLWQLFPKNTQGENGIRLQYRAGASYTDLTYSSDYYWITLNTAWNVPYFSKDSTVKKIYTHPSAITQIGYDRDPVMRVSLTSALSQVQVTGTAMCESYGPVLMYIYKGAGNYANWIWQATLSNNSSNFDFTIDFTSGEELFFAVDSGSVDYNDWARWYNVQLTGLPEPATVAVALLGLGILSLRRRK